MHLSKHWIHGLSIAALIAAALVMMLPKRAGAEDSHGIYTTRTNSTSTSATNTSGVTTTNTTSTTTIPRDIYSSRGEVNRRYWQDRDRRTSDIEARYPYDNTRGQNRSDVDAVRSGFDDPRNPWDGRYVNDNPTNYNATNSGSNAVVNSMRGNESTTNRYRPGRYGTHRVGRD